MTVITTLITRHCTVHATDSFITELQTDGTLKVDEAKQTKIIPVKRFRGAMAYWGLAKINGRWSTLDWLHEQVGRAAECEHPEDFARFVTDSLNQELSRLQFAQPIHAGIGIHFTAYEWIEDCWIPELFLLSNFSGPSYKGLHDKGVLLNRQTFNVAFEDSPKPIHRNPEFRLRVHKYLREGHVLIYNNGDPPIFNSIAKMIFDQIRTISQRKEFVDADDVATYRKIARTLIRFISVLQEEFVRSGKRRVGGKLHDLSITPTGEYGSYSGDAP
jgi:hypothetical protein